MTTEILSNRALGRATLARQHLLDRVSMDPVGMVEHLVGLQSQTPQTWYVGLWDRLTEFNPEAFGRLLEDRVVVRIAAMRSTVHLLSATDALLLRPLTQIVIERSTRGAFGKHWNGLDLEGVTAAARDIVEREPMIFAAIGRELQKTWPDTDHSALGQIARTYLDLVQVTPRGVWQKSGQAKHTTVEAWLGRSVDAAPSIDKVIRRYLAAFGPASVKDVQAWCGLTRLNEVVDRMRPELITFTDAAGRELFDLPDAPRPGEDIPSPPRFLYDFENLLLSHDDRSRFNIHNFFEFGWTFDGAQPSCLLIDGTVEATWLLTETGGETVLNLSPMSKISARVRSEVEEEGMRLVRFKEPKVGDVDIRWVGNT